MISGEVRSVPQKISLRREAAAVFMTAALGTAAVGTAKAQEIDSVANIPVIYCRDQKVTVDREIGDVSVLSEVNTLKSGNERLLRIGSSLVDNEGEVVRTETILVYSPTNSGKAIYASQTAMLSDEVLRHKATKVSELPEVQVPGLFLDGRIPNCIEVFMPKEIFRAPLNSSINTTNPGANSLETFENIYRDLTPEQ